MVSSESFERSVRTRAPGATGDRRRSGASRRMVASSSFATACPANWCESRSPKRPRSSRGRRRRDSRGKFRACRSAHVATPIPAVAEGATCNTRRAPAQISWKAGAGRRTPSPDRRCRARDSRDRTDERSPRFADATSLRRRRGRSTRTTRSAFTRPGRARCVLDRESCVRARVRGDVARGRGGGTARDRRRRTVRSRSPTHAARHHARTLFDAR